MAEETPKGDNEKLLDREMREYGVRRVPVDYFHIGGFRYTDLKDAVAQAKRMKAAKAAI